MTSLTTLWQSIKDTWRNLERTIKLAVTLILAGYVLGWLIAPERVLGSSLLWLELGLPLVLATGLLAFRPTGGRLLAIFLAIFFLATAVADPSIRQPTAGKIKDRATVSVALFEIYPLSGLGLGGYDYHYQQNAPKIISAPVENPVEPHVSLFAWWVSGGLLALAGYVLLVVEIFKRHKFFSVIGLITTLLLVAGPAGSYPFRAIFFIVFWLIAALAINREADA